MRKVIIVQARMGSTRLPGKVLKTVLNKPLLEYQIERLLRVKLADQIVIATTRNETDWPIVDLCKRLLIAYSCGSETDVLARYYDTAKYQKADLVIRVTSDCPLIDPQVINKTVQFYLDHDGEFDFVSNALTRSYPRGMDTEVFPFEVLEEANIEANAFLEREHVTPFIYTRSHRYRIGHLISEEDNSHYRWTVDTPEDFELVRRIIEALYPSKPDFHLQDVLELLKVHPDWEKINVGVRQKRLGE